MFRRKPWPLRVLAGLGVFFVAQGIFTAWFMIFELKDDDTIRWAGAGLALFLAWLGYYFASYAIRRLRGPEAAIVIGPDGLHDRIVSARPIAWSDIQNLRARPGGRGGTIVVFDLREGAEARAGVTFRARWSVGMSRPFGYSYAIRHGGTEADPEKLLAACRPYLPPA